MKYVWCGMIDDGNVEKNLEVKSNWLAFKHNAMFLMLHACALDCVPSSNQMKRPRHLCEAIHQEEKDGGKTN